VAESRESFLCWRWYWRHEHDERQTKISHYCPSHQPATVILSVYSGRHDQGNTVRPRKWGKLTPPSPYHERHEETKDERNWYQIVILLAVGGQSFKHANVVMLHILITNIPQYICFNRVRQLFTVDKACIPTRTYIRRDSHASWKQVVFMPGARSGVINLI